MTGGYTLTIPTMTFSTKDARPMVTPHEDPLVIEVKIYRKTIRRVLIDTGSSVDIITWKCLELLKYEESDMTRISNPIVGFGGR